MVYITGRRFTERTNAVTDVKVYSNAGKVELWLNGIAQGQRIDGTNGVFIWKDVTLKSGENRVEAMAEQHGTRLSDSCTWNLK
jgi:beta-galactosidase